MFAFSKEQKKITIGRLNIGGQPGETPTALFGTVFYGKKYRTFQPEFYDEIRAHIIHQNSMEELTGCPGIVDIFIDREENVAPRIDTVLDILQETGLEKTVSIDIPESSVRIRALEHLSYAGALSHTIYNSINLGITPEEYDAIRDYTPAAAVLLGYNPKNMTADGRIDMIERGGGMVKDGLVKISESSGIKKNLIDTGATPLAHMAAETLRAIPVAKNHFGFPAGCAIHNLVESWLWMKDYKKQHAEEYKICDAGSNGLVTLMGGDFVFYGPAKTAHLVFPWMAMVDKLVSEGASDYFGIDTSLCHPRRRLP